LPSSFILETEKDSRFLQNAGKFLPHYMSHPTAFNKILRLFDNVGKIINKDQLDATITIY